MSKVCVLGVYIDSIPLDELLDKIRAVISANQRALIMHVNIMGLNLAYEQDWFRRILNGSDLVFCDGMGVQLGARLLGHKISQRFTLADWMWQLAGYAETHDFSFYFLGNPPGVALRGAERLRERFPALRVLSTQDGFFDKEAGLPDNQAVLVRINNAKPDILMVGFGMPLQEKWLAENWHSLDVNVAITCGALFEYLAGDLKRGPRWMTQNYLEWLARIIISPNRYVRRYLRDVPLFTYRILRQRLVGAPMISESDRW